MSTYKEQDAENLLAHLREGIDPDSVENNPRMATYFPDPDPAKPQDGGQ